MGIRWFYNCIATLVIVLCFSCKKEMHSTVKEKQGEFKPTAASLLGNTNYLAISYGGYRASSRQIQPTNQQLKEDLKILHAMGIRILRTYNVQADLPHAANVLQAIEELKKEDSSFTIYVMLGAWIDCLNAWTKEKPNHALESPNNKAEIDRAVALANKYPDIVKIIAVGNEAMVKWATNYYVAPKVILNWVNYLQQLKNDKKLPKDLWITSSDDFSSWGGGEDQYKTKDLERLIKAVDYVSMHTYPFHNTHYNSDFWTIPKNEKELSPKDIVEKSMDRALAFAKKQYDDVVQYVKSIDSTKVIHIGETGWSSVSNGFYGSTGSRAADEYKQGLYYKKVRKWTDSMGISCFYFEGFNEQWKDAKNSNGSENHFGLFTINGEAKYPIWDLVDKGIFTGLKRGGNTIKKTYNGDLSVLLSNVKLPNTDYKK